MYAHHEVATPIPCKLDQRVPKNQINTRVSKNTQQAQLRTRRTTENNLKSITNETVVSV